MEIHNWGKNSAGCAQERENKGESSRALGTRDDRKSGWAGRAAGRNQSTASYLKNPRGGGGR
jgi:hypothetical protein